MNAVSEMIIKVVAMGLGFACLIGVYSTPCFAADVYADGFDHTVVGGGTDGTGTPVGNPETNGNSLSLGQNGVVIVYFTDNYVFDGAGRDFTVMDIVTIEENYSVEARAVGSSSWVFIGNGTGTADFDLNGIVNRVDAIRITDNNSTDSSPNRGLDLDAVKVYHPWDLVISKVSSGWLPTGASSINVIATIDPPVNGLVKFHLYEVTTEQGCCMNYGSQTAAAYDLYFGAQSGFNLEDSVTIHSTNEVVATTVTVTCDDYGAFAKLEAYIKQITGTTISPQIKGHVEGGTEEYIAIPRDDDGNKIGDAWMYNTGDRADDQDNSPSGDGYSGDQLTRYEEYRGFMVNGSHKQTNPNSKEVFVFDDDGLGPDYFTESNLGAPVYYLNDSEYELTTRVINAKTDEATISGRIGDQGCVWIVDSNYGLPPGAIGSTIVKDTAIETVPVNVWICRVSVDRITERGTDLRRGITATDTIIGVYEASSYRLPPGYVKIDNEIIRYQQIASDTFLNCIRGEMGTTAASHARYADVSKWIDPSDMVKHVFTHELGHAVHLPEFPNGADNVMDYLSEFGDVKDVNYHNSFGSSLSGYYRVKP